VYYKKAHTAIIKAQTVNLITFWRLEVIHIERHEQQSKNKMWDFDLICALENKPRKTLTANLK